MKLVATGVLAVAAVGFLGLSLVPGDSLAIGALRSALEAATVGGFADWFAVVALFRYPCGVRIPHTALVPNNQARIASSLGTFVETNFIDPDDISAKFGGWLGGEGRKLRTVSFGKEKPADLAHEEGAWARNRRVEIELQK